MLAAKSIGTPSRADHHPPHPAERAVADHGLGDARGRQRDHHRERALLPRPRLPARLPDLGAAALRRRQLHDADPGAGDLARPRDLADRARRSTSSATACATRSIRNCEADRRRHITVSFPHNRQTQRSSAGSRPDYRYPTRSKGLRRSRRVATASVFAAIERAAPVASRVGQPQGRNRHHAPRSELGYPAITSAYTASYRRRPGRPTGTMRPKLSVLDPAATGRVR